MERPHREPGTAGAVRLATALALLAGPTVLAFFSGGFFDQPRLWAGIAAWALVLAALVTVPQPWPRRGARPALLAIGGLAGLTAWTAASLAWAPLAGPAWDDVQRLLLYLGGLIAALLLLRPARAQRAVEPVLALGTFVVVAYGISERLLPGLVDLSSSVSAAGRLEQPLTYWNAMGALAAMGFVLTCRLSADASRPPVLRALAAAATAPLGLGVYLSFSRGALAALAIGLVALVALIRTRAQLRMVIVCLAAGALSALAGGLLPGVRELSDGGRSGEGAAVLACLIAFGGLAGALASRASADGDQRLRLPGPRVALGAVALLLVGAVLSAAALERRPEVDRPARGATAERFGSVESNRYEYWEVALDMFADHPLKGAGAGAFAVDWLREREVREAARDAHSLYIETAAELGLVGLALLAAMFAGVGMAAAQVQRAAPGAAAGTIAALVVWATHAGLDWDWEMPALTLVAVALAGSLLARATPPDEA